MVVVLNMEGDINMSDYYYVSRKRNDGGFEYIAAPSGWRWTENGPQKEIRKGGPEMTNDPYKRHIFASKRGAKIEANKVPGSKVVCAT